MKYKKVLIVLALLLATFLLYCYNDSRKKDMYIVSIQVFDKDGNELEGQFKDYNTCLKEDDDYKTNSAAPIINFYCVTVKENEAYVVKMYFKSAKHYTLTKLVLSNSVYGDSTHIECTDIVKDDDTFIATLYIDKVTKENKIYEVIHWYQNDTMHYFTEMGSNTYDRGVYFYLTDQERLVCKKI